MSRPRAIHSWRLSPSRAIALQARLRNRLITCPLPRRLRLVAGADIAYSRRTDTLIAAVLLFRYPDLAMMDYSTAVRKAAFPYVPGLLSFREAPALIQAFRRLRVKPDVLILDGQGRAHPRGMGLAAHLGLWLDMPTIGCAKSLLCGEARGLRSKRGSRAALTLKGETVGVVLRTREAVKPVYVSAGHRADLAGSVRVVLNCCRGFRLPEPTRLAHQFVTRMRAERDSARTTANDS